MGKVGRDWGRWEGIRGGQEDRERWAGTGRVRERQGEIWRDKKRQEGIGRVGEGKKEVLRNRERWGVYRSYGERWE